MVAFLPPVCHGGVDDAGGLGQGVLNKVLSAGLVLNVSKKGSSCKSDFVRPKTFCFGFLTCYRCFPLPWFLFIKIAHAVSVAFVFVDAKLL